MATSLSLYSLVLFIFQLSCECLDAVINAPLQGFYMSNYKAPQSAGGAHRIIIASQVCKVMSDPLPLDEGHPALKSNLCMCCRR